MAYKCIHGLGNFWYKFAHIPLKRFFKQNFAWRREYQVRTLMPNFITVGWKMWEYSPQNRQNWYFFGINLPKYVYPLNRFLQNLAWGGSLRSVPTCQISPLWLYKCGLTAPKIALNGNVWYKFANKGKFRGRQKKLNIGAQLQTFLYTMTP